VQVPVQVMSHVVPSSRQSTLLVPLALIAQVPPVAQ
jgi:hypothetical protein